MTEPTRDVRGEEHLGQKYYSALDSLFSSAKEKDEFEYALTLLRVRGGIEDNGWDPLSETDAFFSDVTTLVQAPLNGPTKIRLCLMLYCHLLEVESIYWLIENMLRVIEGAGQNLYPFDQLFRRSKTRVIPPSSASVVKFLVDHAKRLSLCDLASHIAEMFDDSIRHAFMHSDYLLHGDEFRSRHRRIPASSEDPQKNIPVAFQQQSIKLPDLMARMNKGIAFYQALRTVHLDHVRSYREPKTIMTRMGRTTFLVDPTYGLYGFQGTTAADEQRSGGQGQTGNDLSMDHLDRS